MKKESAKNRSIQSELLRMAEGFATGKRIRPARTSIEWNRKGLGNRIEDWEFTNEAIKSLMREHYNDAGNPFTQVKIDSRRDLGQYLLERDFIILHTSNGHVFAKGIGNYFGDFPKDNRREAMAQKTDKHTQIVNSKLLQHAQGEGAFFGAAYFMESKAINDFLEVPSETSVALIPSHRRSVSSIQSEIDSMLIWEVEGHTYMAVFETKTDSRKVPNWDSGFSYHQVRTSSLTVGARLDSEDRKNVTIIPVYFRVEWFKNRDEWTARLDRFKEIKDGNSIPQIESSLDILHLPR